MILVRLKGGLGNQLFQYAAAKALALKHNTEVFFDLTLLKDRTPLKDMVFRDYELYAFNLKENFANKKTIEYYNPLPTSIFKRIINKIKKNIFRPSVYIESSHLYNSKFFKLPNDSCLIGLFQSEKYFESIADTIRKEFEFKKTFSQTVNDLGAYIKTKNTICVHIRRGDYVSNPTYSEMLGSQSNQYYTKGVALITEKIAIDELFIFSDDIEWCKQNLKFETKTTFITDDLATNNHHAHLHLMSLCKHFVISNSTFAWWGAWLSSNQAKIVVAPKMWFKDGLRDESDIIPHTWIKI